MASNKLCVNAEAESQAHAKREVSMGSRVQLATSSHRHPILYMDQCSLELSMAANRSKY